MDMMRGEKDLSSQTSCWVPQTPVKPNSTTQRPICSQGEGNQLGYGFDSDDMNKGWEGYGGLGVANRFPVEFEGSGHLNFGELMALADSAAAWRTDSADLNGTGPSNPIFDTHFGTSSSNSWNMGRTGREMFGSCAPAAASYGNGVPFLYDLNSPTTALTDMNLGGNIPFQFAPVTPDQSGKSQNYQNNSIHTNLNQIPAQERVEVGNEVANMTNQVQNAVSTEQQQVQNAVSTGLQEDHNPDFDLNKTPQQKPRRRKHRPKVVIEGKAKRSPKPPKTPAPKENPTGKRKYVRKNPHNKTPSKPVSDIASGSSDPKASQETTTSCKRALNFDFEGQVQEEFPLYGTKHRGNAQSPVENRCDRVISQSVVQLGQGMEAVVEKTQVGIAHDLNRANKSFLENYLSMPQAQASSPSIPNKTHLEPGSWKPCGQSEMPCEGRVLSGDSQTVPRSPNYSNCSSSASVAEGEHAKRLKRGPLYVTEPDRTNVIGGYFNSLSKYASIITESVSEKTITSSIHFSIVQKRKRSQERYNATTSSILNVATPAVNGGKPAMASPPSNARADVSTSGSICGAPALQLNIGSIQTVGVPGMDAQSCQQKTPGCNIAPVEKVRKPRKTSKHLPTIPSPPSNARADVSTSGSICGAPALQLNIGSIQTVGVPGMDAQSCQQKTPGCNIAPVEKVRKPRKTSKHLPTIPSPPNNARADVSTSGSICGAPALQLNIGSIQTVGVPGMDAQSCQQKTPGYNIAPVEKVRKPRKTSKHLPTIPSPPSNARADVSTSGSICGAPALQLNIGSIQTVGVPGMDAQSCQQKTPGCNIAPVEKVRKPRKTSKHLPTIPVGPATTYGEMQVYKMSSHPQTSMEGMLMEHRRRMISKKRMKRNPSSVYTDTMQKQIPSVDEIAEYLKLLDINRESNGVMFQDLRALVPYNRRYGEQNALVLYQKDGTMVPFEGPFDPIRKRKPRPKVDLDDETTRVWRLLLENINNEGIDGTDEEKAKWWEEERRVFRGRADSFIARMHLVQGDRRFSPWKGSVVDSVVGVFLTQNVSDHLSSSAFMSLAARFPLKSDSENSCFEEPNVIIEEPEECPEQLDYQRTSVELHERVCSTQKEAEDSNEILGSVSDGVRSTGNSKCQSPETAEISQISTAGKEMVQPTEPVEILLGEKVMDDMLSSQDSSVSFVESSIAQSTDPSSVSSSSFVELLRAEHLRRLKSRETENGSLYEEASECCGKTQDKDASDKSTTSLRPMMPPNNCPGSFDLFAEASRSSVLSKKGQQNCPSEQSEVTAESVGHATLVESTSLIGNLKNAGHHAAESSLTEHRHPATGQEINGIHSDISRRKSSKTVKPKVNPIDWDGLRVQAQESKGKRAKTANTLDSLDWEAVRCANVNEIADAIKERGMNNMLAERIQAFLNRLVEKHGGIDLEWLRDVPPDKAKEYLLSIRGLGLKSVECVRLLTLHHLAFPVDTNVGRIAVRLGWVPLQPLPESLQLHLLELYPVMESIQKYLWPRLCKLDQRTLYELHYQMITFGKVFCTKSKPNCNACPMRGECRHFASAFASARLALPGPAEKSIVTTSDGKATNQNGANVPTPSQPPLPLPLPPQAGDEQVKAHNENSNRELIVEVATTPFSSVEVPATPAAPSVEMPASPGPIIEVPASPEPSVIHVLDSDIEDAFAEDPDEIPLIRLNIEELTQNLQNYMQHNMELQEGDMNRALVALTPEAASLPTPKLKNVSRLRTEHQVYELPDSHPLLEGMERRDRDDPCSYLLAIWTPGETPTSIQPPEERCRRQESGELCESSTCFSCNSIREANSQIVRGTILIPCRTAMRGSFPLNGTYFQVNEVFADHASSIRPIEVPRQWIWNLPRRTVYFGTSVTSIFKGLSTESIQLCFWRGFVCVRGFDMQSRAPRPLLARLHFTASRLKETTAKGKATAQNQE